MGRGSAQILPPPGTVVPSYVTFPYLAITGTLMLAAGANILGLTGAILTIGSVLAPSGVLSTIGTREIPFTTGYFSTLFAAVIGSGVAPVSNLYASIVRVYDTLTTDIFKANSIGAPSEPVAVVYATALGTTATKIGSLFVTSVGSASSLVTSLYTSVASCRNLQISNPLNSITPSVLTCIGYSAPYSRNMYQIGTSTGDYNLVLSSQAGYLVKYPGPYPVVLYYTASPTGVTATLWRIGINVQQFGFNCGTFDSTNGMFTAAYDGLYNFHNFLMVSNNSALTDLVVNAVSSTLGVQRIGTGVRPTTGTTYLSIGLPYTTFLPAGGTIYFTITVCTTNSTPVSLIFDESPNSLGTYSRLQIWRH